MPRASAPPGGVLLPADRLGRYTREPARALGPEGDPPHKTPCQRRRHGDVAAPGATGSGSRLAPSTRHRRDARRAAVRHQLSPAERVGSSRRERGPLAVPLFDGPGQLPDSGAHDEEETGSRSAPPCTAAQPRSAPSSRERQRSTETGVNHQPELRQPSAEPQTSNIRRNHTNTRCA